MTAGRCRQREKNQKQHLCDRRSPNTEYVTSRWIDFSKATEIQDTLFLTALHEIFPNTALSGTDTLRFAVEHLSFENRPRGGCVVYSIIQKNGITPQGALTNQRTGNWEQKKKHLQSCFWLSTHFQTPLQARVTFLLVTVRSTHTRVLAGTVWTFPIPSHLSLSTGAERINAGERVRREKRSRAVRKGSLQQHRGLERELGPCLGRSNHRSWTRSCASPAAASSGECSLAPAPPASAKAGARFRGRRVSRAFVFSGEVSKK